MTFSLLIPLALGFLLMGFWEMCAEAETKESNQVAFVSNTFQGWEKKPGMLGRYIYMPAKDPELLQRHITHTEARLIDVVDVIDGLAVKVEALEAKVKELQEWKRARRGCGSDCFPVPGGIPFSMPAGTVYKTGKKKE